MSQEIIYGKNPVVSYLKSEGTPTLLYVQKNSKTNDVVSLAKRRHVSIKFVEKVELDRLTKGVHQGLALEIAEYSYTSLDTIIKNARNQLIVVCDQLEDPHNLGAILRTCDATGVDGVVIGKHRSVSLNATVAKVSTGAINTVPVAQVTNINQSLEMLKENGYWVVAAENGVNAVNYTDFAVDMPIALVVGSEGNGISKNIIKNCDILTTIPMTGSVNSLNVSVATAILLYDIKRRRGEN